MKNKWLAFFLSFLVPGLGQLYVGQKIAGFSFLCITAGAVVSLAVSRSWLAALLIGPLWIFVMAPSAVDAYQTAQGKPRRFKGESVLYVIFMLFLVGPFAIPLLWQSPRFSRGAKIFWTALVLAVALLVVFMLGFVASTLDEVIKQTDIATSA